MNRCWILVLFAFFLVSCASHDEQYYRAHPKALQKALKACPQKQPNQLSCDELDEIANRLNHLAYQLQFNPQAFGNKILVLQQTIAKQELELKNGANSNTQASLEQNKKELFDYLTVVKWLESPES